MTSRNNRFAILGDGRLARHMQAYLRMLDIPCTAWARNPDSPFNTHPDRSTRRRLRRSIEGASHILLLISDDAIAPLVRRYPELHSHTLVHFAGALSLPGVAGAHPLMTFGRDLYTLETYRAIPFMVEAGHAFEDLLPGLPNPHHSIDTGDKALYHALCVMAGNFPQVLWQAVADRFEARLGVSGDVLDAYLRRSLENFLADPAGALTGPLARGDEATIRRNRSALAGDGLQAVYRAFESFYASERQHPGLREVAS